MVFVEPPPKDLWPFWLLFKKLTFVVARLGLPETEAQLKLKKTIKNATYKAICLGSLFM